MTPQELNIEKQKAEIKKNQFNKPNVTPQMPQQVQQHMPQQMPQSTINQQTRINNETPAFTAFGNSTPRREQPTIRTPDQVKDILNRIHNIQPNNIKQSNTETQDETSSNNDRIVSESTLSDTNPNKKKYARKPKKSGISII